MYLTWNSNSILKGSCIRLIPRIGKLLATSGVTLGHVRVRLWSKVILKWNLKVHNDAIVAAGHLMGTVRGIGLGDGLDVEGYREESRIAGWRVCQAKKAKTTIDWKGRSELRLMSASIIGNAQVLVVIPISLATYIYLPFNILMKRPHRAGRRP